jgi:tryptophan synthase alpha chain
MNVIRDTFKKKPVFIGYLTAGDGGVSHSIACAKALIAGGVDILEIGVPFSDPIADGPVIQRAMQRALQQDTTLDRVLEVVRALKTTTSTPIVLFSYFNPLLAAQKKQFLEKAADAGVDAMLIVDLPLEEAEHYYSEMKSLGILPVHVITPATPPHRIQQLDACNETFLYYACRKGTTGMRDQLPDDLVARLKHSKRLVKAPIAVGFGIADKLSAQRASAAADGFVVGSFFVKAIEAGATPAELKKAAAELCSF